MSRRRPLPIEISHRETQARADEAEFISPPDENGPQEEAENEDDHASQPSPDIYAAPQPLPLLVQTFASYPDAPPASFYASLARFFVRRHVSTNEILWKQGDPADALYLIEAGSLRATYAYHDDREWIQETMVAGTVAGDLSMLSETQRNATVVVERPGTLWYLDKEGLRGMYEEDAQKAREFVRAVLKSESEILRLARARSSRM